MKIPTHFVLANQTATSMLVEGRLDESIQLLRKALSELRALIQSLGYDDDDDDDDDVSMTDESASVVLHSVPILVPEPSNHSASGAASSNLHGGAFSFFNRAIILPTAEGQTHVTMDEFKLGAVLLYNAGLSCHLKGTQSGSTLDLAQALEFYRHAFQLLTDSDAILSINDDDALLVLSLANNMGYLHSNLFDRTASQVCWDMLQKLFAASADASTLSGEDALFFYLATFLVPIDQLTASPAA